MAPEPVARDTAGRVGANLWPVLFEQVKRDTRHLARRLKLGLGPGNLRAGQRGVQVATETRSASQFEPFADFRIDRGIVGRGRCVVSRDRGPQLAFCVLMGRAERAEFGALFVGQFGQFGQLSESRSLFGCFDTESLGQGHDNHHASIS